MGRGINKAVLVGKVSEHRHSQKRDGAQRFILTTAESYVNGDGESITSEGWVRVTTPPGTPFTKNDEMVVVIGRVANRSYTKEGVEIRLTEIATDIMATVPDGTPHANQVVWSGRLAADPEMRYTASGTAITNLRSATGDKYTDRNGNDIDTTCWATMVVWRKLAELINERLRKGQVLTCTGRISSRTYTDRDGNNGESTDITVLDVELPRAERQTAPVIDDSDVPF